MPSISRAYQRPSCLNIILEYKSMLGLEYFIYKMLLLLPAYILFGVQRGEVGVGGDLLLCGEGGYPWLA